MSKIEDIKKYGFYIEDGKQYVLCTKCKKIVRANKPIFGSIHLCDGDD